MASQDLAPSKGNVNGESYQMSSRAESAETNGENGHKNELHQTTTAGGSPNDTTQPSLPVVHRKFANPAPLGLLSFATGVFLISMFGIGARGIDTPNVMIGVLMFFGGICQFISGIMEFIAGNTFGATVFPSYGAFNFSYAMIYIPGTGILDSYKDASGQVNAQFDQALAMYVWAWFILTVLYTIAAMRSSWILFLDLLVLDIDLLLLACGYMLGMDSLLKAGNALGLVVAFLSYWAGIAGLWANGITPIRLPTFPMYTDN